MNEEILEYLRGQFGDDYMSLQTEQELRDYENGVFRRGILNGYSMIEMQPAMDQLRTEFVKKKEEPISFEERYNQVVEETGYSPSEDSPYAGGLGYDYSGDLTPTETAVEKKVAQQETDSLIKDIANVSYDQVYNTYKYLGYSDEKAESATNAMTQRAQEEKKPLNQVLNETYVYDYGKFTADAKAQGDITIENQERYKSLVDFGAAAQEATNVAYWLDKDVDIHKAADDLGLSIKSHNVLYEDYLTPGEDVFSYWLIDEENAPKDKTGVGNDLIRFYNRAVISKRQADMFDPLVPLEEVDFTALAYYQKQLRENQSVGWDTDNGLLKGVDVVLSSVISPVLESAAAMWMGVLTDPATIAASVATGGAALSYGFGKEGLALEYSSKILEVFNELGYDTTDPSQLLAATQNPEVMAEAKSRGLKKGIPIAIVDTISAGLGGRIFKGMMSKGYSRFASRFADEAGEGLAGATGEALGQLVETGEIYDVKGIALEAIGQGIQTAPVQAYMAVKNRDMSKAEAEYVRFAVTETDAHELTTVATAMNYNEVQSLDQKIKEQNKAARKAKTREARITHRENARKLREQKYETLNKNIETLRNLSKEKRAEVASLTENLNNHMVELRRFEDKNDPGRKAVIEEIGKNFSKIQAIVNPSETRPTPFGAETVEGVQTPSVESVSPQSVQKTEEPVSPPTILELDGRQAVVKLPTGRAVRGVVAIDEGGKVTIEDANNNIVELGFVGDIGGQTIEEAGFGSFVSKLNDDGSFEIRGKRYTAPKGKKSVNFNDKGEVVSVTLKDSKGRNRTFRGDVAQEVTFYFSEPQTTNEDTRSIEEVVVDTELGEMGLVPFDEEFSESQKEQQERQQQTTAPEQTTQEPVQEAPQETMPTPALSSFVRTILPKNGVTERVAKTTNKLVKALKDNIGKDVKVNFWTTAEEMQQALGLGDAVDGYYDFKTNSINLTINATDEVIREEFGHAGFGGIMSDDKVRTRLYNEVKDLAKKNDQLGIDIEAREIAYRQWGKQHGMSESSINAMIEEEVVMMVLSQYASNMNQIDASFKAKLRRIINNALVRIGLKKLTITDNTSLDRLAETFAIAFKQGKPIKQRVSQPYRTKPVPDGGRANITMLADALGLDAKTIKQIDAKVSGETFTFTSAPFMKRRDIGYATPEEAREALGEIDDVNLLPEIAQEDLELGMGAMATEIFDVASQALEDNTTYNIEMYTDYDSYKIETDLSIKGKQSNGKPTSRNLRIPIVTGGVFMPRTAEEYVEQTNKGTINTLFPEEFNKMSPGEQLPPRFFALMPDRGSDHRRVSKTGGTGKPHEGAGGAGADQYIAQFIYDQISDVHIEYLREGAFKSPMVLFGDDAVYLGVYKGEELIGHVYYEDMNQYLDGDTSVLLDANQFYSEVMEAYSDVPVKGLPKEALDIYMKGIQAYRSKDFEYLNSEEHRNLYTIQMSPGNVGWVPGIFQEVNMYHTAYRDARKIFNAVLEKELNNGNIADARKKAVRVAKESIDISMRPLEEIFAMQRIAEAQGIDFPLMVKPGDVLDYIDENRMVEFDRGVRKIMFDLIDLDAPNVTLRYMSFLDKNEDSESIEPYLETFEKDEYVFGTRDIDPKEYKAYTTNFGSDVTWYIAGQRVPQTMNELLADADNIADPLQRINYLSYMTSHIVNLEGDINAEIDNKLFQQKVKEKIESSRDELLSGRAALNKKAIETLKANLVAAKRVGQGIGTQAGKKSDIASMSAETVRAIPPANRNARSIYVDHAVTLINTENHPIMGDVEVPAFIDNMPKEDYSREGMVTLYHGGFGLENISNDRPLYISPEESEAQDYARLQDIEETLDPSLINPVYIEETRIATEEKALEVARKLFPEKMTQYDTATNSMFFMLIDREGSEARDIPLSDFPFMLTPQERKKLFKAIEKEGFDAVRFSDQQADETKSPRIVQNVVVVNPKNALDSGSMKLQSQKEWADGVYATFKERVVSNLLFLHDLADPEVREYMRRWYDGANKIAKDMSDKYGISVEQSSGILAALSPGADWFINIQNAYNIAEVLYNHQDKTFDDVMYNQAISRKLESYRDTGPNSKVYKKKHKGKKMTPSKLLKKDRTSFDSFKESMDTLRGRTLSSMDALEKAKFIRYYREVYMPSTVSVYNPVGDNLGVYTKKNGEPKQVVTQSFSNMAKAVMMFENNDIALISSLLGGSHKIRHFYNNIANPDATDGDVTMDTHAIAAAELMPYGQSSTAVNENFGSGAKSSGVFGLSGTYWAYLDAYTEAANQRGILPREMQSITWEVIRLFMPSTMRGKESRADIAEIYNDYKGQPLEDVQNEIKKYFDEKDTDTETPRGTNIKHPGWYRPDDSEGDTSQGEGSDQGDVPGGDVSGGTSTEGDISGGTPDSPGRAALRIRGGAERFVDMLKGGVPQEVAFAEALVQAQAKAQKGKLKTTDELAEFFYEPQRIKEIQGDLSGMRTSDIVAMLKTNALRDIVTQGGRIDFDTSNNFLVLAQVEYLERLRAQGDMEGYRSELAKLGQMGTTFGQLLRQFGEIKTKTAEGLTSIIAAEYEKKGTPLKDEALEKLGAITDEYIQAKQEFDKIVDEVFETDPEDFDAMDKKVQEAQERLEKAIGAINDFQKFNAPSWGTLLSTIMQGNLLTLKSITTNIVANAFTLPGRLAQQLIATPIEYMINPKDRELRPSFGAMIYGMKQSFAGLKQAFRQIKTGQADGDFEYTAGYQIRPLVALATVFGRGKESLPQEFHSQLDYMDYKAKKLFEGVFGLTASSNFSLLVLGDRPFYKGMEGYELYQQAKGLGLEGDELKKFLKYPTEKHMKKAREAGLKLTFQENDSTILLGLVNTDQVQKLFNRAGAQSLQSDSYLTQMMGSALKFLVKSNFPFVKTPFNILSQSLEITMFPITMAQAFVPSKRMSSRDRAEKLATGLMGYMLYLLARNLYDKGVISGAVDKVSPKVRSAAYEQEPPFTINVSAMGREEGAPFQAGDRRVGYAKLGLYGAVLAAYVEAFKAIDRKQDFSSKQELVEYGIDEQSPVSKFAENSLGIVLGSLGALMDQSFLTGLENITKLLQNTEDINVVSKYIEQVTRAMVSVPLPNIYTSFFRAEREFLPDYRDVDFDQRFKNVIYDRTFGAIGRGDDPAPVRINIWGEKIHQTPEGTNPVFYEFLDPTGTRLTTDDPLKVELYNLYKRTGDEDALPSIPSLIMSKRVVRDKGLSGINFTTQEANELLMLLGQERTKEMRNAINGVYWNRLPDEKKVEIIKDINNKYSRGYITLDKLGNRKNFKWYIRREELIRQKKGE